MIVKEIKTNKGYLLFIVWATISILSFFFVFSNLKANSFYNKAQYLVKPYYVKSEKLYYYQDKLKLISKAIRFAKGDAQYYTKKADYLQKAIEDNLGEELFINKKSIEELYAKAAELNPSNFIYHFKLGWFYTKEEQFREAEKELLKSHDLYPIEIQVYLYLARYYLKASEKGYVKEGEWKSFKRLLEAIHFSKLSGDRKFLGDIKEITKDLNNISWDNQKQGIIYTKDLGSNNYDFKEHGFPHKKIPLIVRLYIKDPAQEVVLYRGIIRFKDFKKVKFIEEYNVYEAKIDSFPEDTYLDDFRIETHPSALIEKVEITISFN